MTGNINGKRVGFFIAGTQKSGTTALYSFLSSHPAIEMSKVKEPHFFDNESLDWSKPDYSLLSDQFDGKENKLLGEATPSYIFWPDAMERMRAYNPEAKLVFLLRHPAFRAYSAWRMEIARKVETLDFMTAIGPVGRSRITSLKSLENRHFSYIERGFYSGQIENALKYFPHEQILFIRSDEMWSDFRSIIGKITDFLGLKPDETIRNEYIVPLQSSHIGEMSLKERKALDAIYEDDIKATAALTGLDLADWLEAEYQEPMTQQ